MSYEACTVHRIRRVASRMSRRPATPHAQFGTLTAERRGAKMMCVVRVTGGHVVIHIMVGTI